MFRTCPPKDQDLVDVLFALIASCMKHVATQMRAANESMPDDLRARLDGLSLEPRTR